MFRYIPIIITAVICGCDNPTFESARECNIYSSMKYDVDPYPKYISISLRICDDGINELLVSLSDGDKENNRVLVKERITRSGIDGSTKLSDLGISIKKSEFREYTITLPSDINVSRYMQLEERNGLNCQDINDIALCFGT